MKIQELICLHPESKISVNTLLRYFLYEAWMYDCEIIVGYKETNVVAVKYQRSYLRYSEGPKQGYFWDCYPDDMQSPELAIYAISKSMSPHSRIR